MHLLVLDDVGFLGYHAVAAALGQGHEVTVLSRSGESPVEGALVLTGDRDGDLSVLRGRTWDAVLDTHTDLDLGAPTIRRTAELLHGSVGVYGYLPGSRRHAEARRSRPDETPAEGTNGPEPDDDREQQLPPSQRDAEEVLTEVFGQAALLPRAGVLIGPRDPSDRFTYWPVRLARAREGTRSGPVLAPGDPARTVQYGDVRDVADWLVRALAEGRHGMVDATGPGRTETLGEALAACGAAAGGRGDIDLVWADEDWLREQLSELTDWRRPLWFPEEHASAPATGGAAAPAEGLVFRPLAETARDTLVWAWDHALSSGLASGLTDERESELVERWRASGRASLGDRRGTSVEG